MTLAEWLAASPYGLGLFFAIGLLGGAHCLGMCGPLVTTYATRMRGGERADAERSDGGRPATSAGAREGQPVRVGWREVRQHGLFNLGRTVAYAAVGTGMGALGALVYGTAGVFAFVDTVRATAGVLAGLFIFVVGGRYLLGRPGGADTLPGTGRLFDRLTGTLTARIDAWVNGPRIVALGAVHAVLPCPILYPAYLYAFTEGSPLAGGLALGAVGLGTFPTLFALGTLWTDLSARTRGRIHRALGAVFVALGVVALSHGLNLFGVPVPRVPLPVYQPLG